MLGKRLASVACATFIGLTGVMVTSSPANAVGGNCEARVGHQVRDWLPDLYRPEGLCHSLHWDSKGRGLLDLAYASDPSTPWFTQTGVWHSGGWDDYIGVRGAYPQIRAL